MWLRGEDRLAEAFACSGPSGTLRLCSQDFEETGRKKRGSSALACTIPFHVFFVVKLSTLHKNSLLHLAQLVSKVEILNGKFKNLV